MSDEERIRILIADDHAVVRKGLVMVLRLEADFEIVGEAENGAEAVELAQQLQPDLVLLDLVMPQMDGLQLCDILKNDEKTNGGGKTIGDILITTPIPSGETGVISYEKVMDLFNNQAKEYFGNVFNQSKSVQETYNYGIWQLISQKRIYTKGTLQTFGEITADTPIFGISSKFTPRVDDLFNEMDKDIDLPQGSLINYNYLMGELVKTGKYEQYLPNIKTNFKNYVNNLKSELLSTISEKNNNLSKQEINMVQTIRKLNIVADLTHLFIILVELQVHL